MFRPGKAAEAVAPYLKGVDPFVKEGDACVKGASGDARSGLEGTGGQVSPAKIVKNYLIFWSEPFEESLEAYRLATRGVSSAGITLTKEHTAMQIIEKEGKGVVLDIGVDDRNEGLEDRFGGVFSPVDRRDIGIHKGTVAFDRLRLQPGRKAPRPGRGAPRARAGRGRPRRA